MSYKENPIKVTYEFFLPEHEMELKNIQNADSYRYLIEDITSMCRSKFKYEQDVSEETREFARLIYTLINGSINSLES